MTAPDNAANELDQEILGVIFHFAKDHTPEQIPTDLRDTIAGLLYIDDSELAGEAIAEAWASPTCLALAATIYSLAICDDEKAEDNAFAWSEGFRAGYAIATLGPIAGGPDDHKDAEIRETVEVLRASRRDLLERFDNRSAES